MRSGSRSASTSSGRSSVRYVGLDAEQGFPHERGAARTPVRRVADGVPRAGVDPPDGEPVGQCEGADDLGRPADQRQDVRLLAVRCRHLIHRSARRARDELLRAMSEQRQAARLERVAERPGRRLRDSDLDRSRGTETLALRHRRGDDEPQPREGEPLLSGQQRDRSQHIRGPRILTGEAARQLVERRLDEIRRGEGEAPTPADCDDLAVRGNLCSRQHGLPDREAEDEPTGIVGDAAEDVEASRRPGDDHRLLRHEQRVTPCTRRKTCRRRESRRRRCRRGSTAPVVGTIISGEYRTLESVRSRVPVSCRPRLSRRRDLRDCVR